MSNTYARIVPLGGALIAFTIVTGASALAQAPDPSKQQPSSQQPSAQQPSQQPPSTQQPSQQQKPAEQIARGELASVDTTSRMLTLKPTQGAEQKFQYNEQTKVTGGSGGVAGLATMSGRQVVVHYSTQGANRVATEIEIQPEGAGKEKK